MFIEMLRIVDVLTVFVLGFIDELTC